MAVTTAASIENPEVIPVYPAIMYYKEPSAVVS